MSFQPVIPLPGYAGWSFLKRTMATQQATQQSTPMARREQAYFRANIGKIDTAGQLVADRRLLNVALTAFGLEGDIKNKAFIRKVLEEGTLETGSLANRLANKQYQKLSAAFGFGDMTTPRNKISDFADKILALYNTRAFETAVGAQNNEYRIALNAEREIAVLAARSESEDAKWYTILGSAPLREAFQTALGLPSSFASIDLDTQLSMIKAKARSMFGSDTVSQFAEAAKMDKLVRTYILRAESGAVTSGSSPGSVALQLLSSLTR